LSPSASQSATPSSSPSASVSPSQAAGSGYYSYVNQDALPTTKNDLTVIYGEDDETDVSTDNAVRVSVTGAEDHLIHQWKKVNNTNRDSIKVKVNLQSTIAPTTSTIYLQVWNENTSAWETIASNNTALADTDFDLEYTISSNVTNYYDSTYEVAFRVYQTNPYI